MTTLPIRELQKALAKKEFSALELTEECIEKTAQADSRYTFLITENYDGARSCAADIDRRRKCGENLPTLAGIPTVLKDNLCTKGIRTTCASRMLEHFIPPYSATVAELLESSPLLGKSNMDEFAMGSTCEHSAFFPTRNPLSPDRTPGGSSGGSAAAVASDSVPFALGSDTGGSARLPASYCALVGMKPTYGLVSRYGLIAFASSLDQIAPLCRTVEDCAFVLDAITSPDRRDPTCRAPEKTSFAENVAKEPAHLRIGIIKELYPTDEDIREALNRAQKAFRKLDATFIELSVANIGDALPAYYIISSAEASSNLARYDGVRYGFCAEGCQSFEEQCRRSRTLGFGGEVKRRIMLGAFALGAGHADAYYRRACRARQALTNAFVQCFTACDLILLPTALSAPPLLSSHKKATDVYRGDLFTVIANLTGMPALSLPCMKNREGLPIGVQLMAPAFHDGELLCAAYALEKALEETDA